MRTFVIALATAAGVAVGASHSLAAGEAPLAPPQHWSFSGMFGTFERPDLQRGFQVYREVCHSCHSLDLVAFRNLEGIGFTPDQVAAIAAEFQVIDGPNDEGDMFERPGRASDHIPAPFPNEQAARAANGGALPPDLSLITKSRAGESMFNGTKFREYGADYVYALMNGYMDPPPHGQHVMEGRYYNTYFHGHQIAMPPPLSDGMVEYADGTDASLGQEARDVATFLSWAADPNVEERRRMGVKVVLFLIVLTGLLFALKKQIWSDVHH